MSYKKIERCRICGNTELIQVLDLGVQALTGVFPKSTKQAITAGPLRLVKCIGGSEVCGLLQLEHSYDLGEMYGDNYGYRSGLNASMVSHLQAKVRKILGMARFPTDALVVDIGSNDSTTLQAYPQDGLTLLGIDPTASKFRSFYPPHIGLIPDFFSAKLIRERFGDRKASVVTSFSMFYDLEASSAVHERRCGDTCRRWHLGVRAELHADHVGEEFLRHSLSRAPRILRTETDPLDGHQSRPEDRRCGIQRRERRQFLRRGRQPLIEPRSRSSCRRNLEKRGGSWSQYALSHTASSQRGVAQNAS